MPGFARRTEKSHVTARVTKYPEELLERGTRLVFESGRPIAHVARDLGLPPETLRKYVRQVEANEGRRKDLLTDAEREETKQLRRENSSMTSAAAAGSTAVAEEANRTLKASRKAPAAGAARTSSRQAAVTNSRLPSTPAFGDVHLHVAGTDLHRTVQEERMEELRQHVQEPGPVRAIRRHRSLTRR
jgi:transposase